MFRSLCAQLLKPNRVSLDNFIFRLHYRVTVGLLLACAVALLWKINYGEPISCLSRDAVADKFLNDHCWYHGVYTNPELDNKTVGVEIPAPGVGKTRGKTELRYHNVHRWIVFFVLVQAAFFFLPRIIWRGLEGRQVQRWTWKIENSEDSTDALNKFRKELIVGQFRTNSVQGWIYYFGHVLSEALNLINVVVQLGIVCYLLQSYGSIDLLVKSRAERVDVSATKAFPFHTSCTLLKYGPSGDVQRHDMLCAMTINTFTEAILVCQCVWFTLLALLSLLALVYHLALLILPPLRIIRLEAKIKLVNRNTLENVTSKLGVGQWFMLYMLSKNVDPVYIRDIVESINEGFYSRTHVQPMADLSVDRKPLYDVEQ